MCSIFNIYIHIFSIYKVMFGHHKILYLNVACCVKWRLPFMQINKLCNCGQLTLPLRVL